jgi:hypothetical protein
LNRICFFLLSLVIFFAPVNKFFISIGFRIQYYEVLGLFFIVSVIFLRKSPFKNIILSDVHYVLIFQWLNIIFILLLSCLSFLNVNKSINEFYFFLKGYTLLIIIQLLLTSIFYYINSLSYNFQQKIVSIFIYANVFSGLYGILQIFFFIVYSFDIDNFISNSLPLSGIELDISGSALGSFFRLSGLTGDPSVQASFSIMPIIVLSYNIFVKKIYSHVLPYILIIISFILTMSGSGIVGLFVSFLIIAITKFRSFSIRFLIKMLIIFSPILLLILFNFEEVQFFFNHKFQEGGTTKVHADIANRALNIGLDYPIFGVGYNNFAFIYEQYYGESNYNAHNSWLNYFVETGFLGLLVRCLNFLYVLFIIMKNKSDFKIYFLAGFIGLNVASLGYETINYFYNQSFLLVLLYLFRSNYFDKKYLLNQ